MNNVQVLIDAAINLADEAFKSMPGGHQELTDNVYSAIRDVKNDLWSEKNEEPKYNFNKLDEALQAALESESSEKIIKKQIDKIAEEIEMSVTSAIQDNLVSNLMQEVEEIANNAIEKLLRGDEETLQVFVKFDRKYYNGRSDGNNFSLRKLEEQHPVIHENLSEQGCVALRKAIVNANKDILQNERILDLEDQVKSLVEQVKIARKDKDLMYERLRQYQ